MDAFGANSPLTVHSISDDYGLLMTDLLLSPYVDVMSGLTDDISTEQETIAKNFKSYFAPHMEGRHQILESAPANLDFKQKSNVISLTNALVGLGKSDIEGMLNRAWEQVKPGGLLVVYEDFGSNMHDLNVSDFTSMLEKFGEVQIYLSIVAAKIQENVEISHYSSIQEAKLGEEKRDQIKVYRVVHKAAK